MGEAEAGTALLMLIFFAICGAIWAIFNHARYVALREEVTRALVKHYSGFQLSEDEEQAVALLRSRRPEFYTEAEMCARMILTERRKQREQ